MTVKECYEAAVGFLPEGPEENPEMQRFAVGWCNILLAELLEYENICRIAKGGEELLSPPKVYAMEEEIPYDENLVRKAFPYGMARWVFRENDDIAASHEYYNLYVFAAREAVPVIRGEVRDEYD